MASPGTSNVHAMDGLVKGGTTTELREERLVPRGERGGGACAAEKKRTRTRSKGASRSRLGAFAPIQGIKRCETPFHSTTPAPDCGRLRR